MAIHRVFDSPTRPRGVRHRAPGLRPQAADRPGRRLRQAPPGGRPQRLPQPGRVRPRHRRELPRLHRPVVRRRAGQGLRDPRRGPARGRRHRRRRAHRRHGLGGAQQHRDREQQQARHRRQRQRPLLHPDHRRTRDRARRPAHQPALRAGPRPGQAPPERRPRRRPRGVRRAARDEEGHEGRASRRRGSSRTSASSTSVPSTATTGPRWSRCSRRPSGSAARSSCTRSPARASGTTPRSATRPTSSTRPGRSTSVTGEENPKGRIWTDVFADEIVHIGQRRKDVVGDHRRDDAPGRAPPLPGPVPRPHVRRRHRRAARRHSAPPGSPWAACTRWSRSTPRSSTAPSTRC